MHHILHFIVKKSHCIPGTKKGVHELLRNACTFINGFGRTHGATLNIQFSYARHISHVAASSRFDNNGNHLSPYKLAHTLATCSVILCTSATLLMKCWKVTGWLLTVTCNMHNFWERKPWWPLNHSHEARWRTNVIVVASSLELQQQAPLHCSQLQLLCCMRKILTWAIYAWKKGKKKDTLDASMIRKGKYSETKMKHALFYLYAELIQSYVLSRYI